MPVSALFDFQLNFLKCDISRIFLSSESWILYIVAVAEHLLYIVLKLKQVAEITLEFWSLLSSTREITEFSSEEFTPQLYIQIAL